MKVQDGRDIMRVSRYCNRSTILRTLFCLLVIGLCFQLGTYFRGTNLLDTDSDSQDQGLLSSILESVQGLNDFGSIMRTEYDMVTDTDSEYKEGFQPTDEKLFERRSDAPKFSTPPNESPNNPSPITTTDRPGTHKMEPTTNLPPTRSAPSSSPEHNRVLNGGDEEQYGDDDSDPRFEFSGEEISTNTNDPRLGNGDEVNESIKGSENQPRVDIPDNLKASLEPGTVDPTNAGKQTKPVKSAEPVKLTEPVGKSNVPAVKEDVSTAPTSTKTQIIIYTEGRSGSTWLSSWFNNNPQVFGIYEPFFQTPEFIGEGCFGESPKRRECQTEILNKLFHCDFRSSKLSVLGKSTNIQLVHPECLARETKCSVEELENQCKERTHTVPKIIRFFDMNDLEEIMRDPEYNIKVIHLLRDPRPLVNSRSKTTFGTLDGIHHVKYSHKYTYEEYLTESKTLCDRILRACKVADSEPEWLKGRYLRVTHKELSLEPLESAKKIYQFSELEWTEQMEDFILKTTAGEVGSTGQFGINRISVDVIDNWKRTMSPSVMKIVTKMCLPLINYLGAETEKHAIVYGEERLDEWNHFGVEFVERTVLSNQKLGY